MVLILDLLTRPMFQPRALPTILLRVSAKASLKAFLPQTSTASSWMDPLTQATWKTNSTHDHAAQEIRSCVRYLSLEVPMKADADGLIKCVGNALQTLGVQNILDRSSVLRVQGKPILIGRGTDGASVNIAEQKGMKGKLQKGAPMAVLDMVLFSSP